MCLCGCHPSVRHNRSNCFRSFAPTDRMLPMPQSAGDSGTVPAASATPSAQGNAAVPATPRLPVRYFSLERLPPPSTNTHHTTRTLPHPSQHHTTISHPQRHQRGEHRSAAGGCSPTRGAVSRRARSRRWCFPPARRVRARGCWTRPPRRWPRPGSLQPTPRSSCCGSAASASSVPQWASRAFSVPVLPVLPLPKPQRSRPHQKQQHQKQQQQHRQQQPPPLLKRNQRQRRRKRKRTRTRRRGRRGCATARRGRS